MEKKNSASPEFSFQISGKSVLLIIISAFILTALIIGLNRLNHSRKYTLFKELNAVLESSEYAARLLPLIEKFNPTDSLLIHEINQNLVSIVDEEELVDDADLYIRYDNRFYKIIRNSYSCYTQLVDEMNYLPKNISVIIEYINNEVPDIKHLYELTNIGKDNYTMIRIGNGYLLLTDYRH